MANRRHLDRPCASGRVLLIELVVSGAAERYTGLGTQVAAKGSRIALFGPYLIGVELASMLACWPVWWAHITWASGSLETRRFNMTLIPMRDGLMLAGILFSLGLTVCSYAVI